MNADCDFSAALRLDLARWVDDGAGPGVIAAVLSGGQIRSWASRGRAGLGPDAATLTPKTVFYVASVSKQFTAACVACCEAAGRLEVGASVRRYLPELPAAFEPVALEHLLHHLGGLPDDQALRAAAGLSGEIWEGCGLWDLVALLAAAPQLVRAPGERHAYSNAGYWLLAACVERASQRFSAFAREQLFQPLGMGDSRFRDHPDAPQPGLALGHAARDDRLTPIRTRFHAVGDGGLLTTIEDLAKWDLFWSGRSPLGAALPARLVQPGRRNDGAGLYYAWGVAVRGHRGTPCVSHGGSYLGYLAKLARFPDHDFSVACLANADNIDVDALAMALADAVLGRTVDQAAPSWADTYREDALAAPPG